MNWKSKIAGLLAVLAAFAVFTAAPASAATASATCVANDSGYRIKVTLTYSTTSANNTVNITKAVTNYQHRLLGVWYSSDWALLSTERVYSGSTKVREWVLAPGASNTLNITTGWRANALYTVSASNTDDTVRVSNCAVVPTPGPA